MQHSFKQLIALMLVCACGYGAAANAATFVSSGHAAGPQCATAGVNDSAQVVGNCNPATPSASANAWFSPIPAGPQQVLLSLITGQPCSVSAIANNGWIVGLCANTGNVAFAVFWNASSPGSPPIAMNALPGKLLLPLLRPADKQTVPTAQNQNGVVAAQSLSANGDATVVVYTAGNATPQRVSGWGDNCTAVDLTETLTNGWPVILMNCPGSNGTPVVTIATWSGGGFALVTPPLPLGASYCQAVDMNDAGQFVGTCMFPGSSPDKLQTTYWASASSTPSLLTMPLNAQNVAMAINALGHVVAYGRDPSGRLTLLFWPTPANPFTVQSIPPLPGSNQVSFAGFGDDDTVAMTCINSSQYPTACYWTNPSGTLPVLGLGGLTSESNGLSPAGTFIFGSAKDAGMNSNAVVAPLP